MEPREVVEQIVTEVAPNAAVAAFEEDGRNCRVTIVGTTGVEAACKLPRAMIEAAEQNLAERLWVRSQLRRCADDVDAPLPDGRG